MSDKFAKLKAIESGQAPASAAQNVRFWSFEKDGNIMGTIVNFGSFTHKSFGEQQTLIVRLAESDELISAILGDYLLEGMSRKRAAVGDLVLIQSFGKQPGKNYNRYNLEIQKAQPEMF